MLHCCHWGFALSQGSVIAYGPPGIAWLSQGWALMLGVGIVTIMAARVGRQGVCMYGGCWSGHCGYGCEVSWSPFFCHLILLTPRLEQLTLDKKALVSELGLVLELDPVSGLMASHCMLQDHDFKHLLGLWVGKLTVGKEGTDAGRQTWIPSFQSGQKLERSSSQRCQKCSSALIVMQIATRASSGALGWWSHCWWWSGVCLSSPSNIIFSWYQPVL